MSDSFLKLQEMCSFSQNVCIEVYGIFITRLTPVIGSACTCNYRVCVKSDFLCTEWYCFNIDFQRNVGITDYRMDYRMFGYESFDLAALPGLFGLKPLRPGTPQPKSFVFIRGASRARLHSLVIILTLALVPKTTVTEYHNQTNVIHSRYTLKDWEGKLKGMPGSTTI